MQISLCIAIHLSVLMGWMGWEVKVSNVLYPITIINKQGITYFISHEHQNNRH